MHHLLSPGVLGILTTQKQPWLRQGVCKGSLNPVGPCAWAGVSAHACAHPLLDCLGHRFAQSPAALWPGNIRCGNLGGADNPRRLAANPAKQELLAPGLIHYKCASMWFQSGAPTSPPHAASRGLGRGQEQSWEQP